MVKEKGFTLEGAKKTLKAKPEKIKEEHSVIARLEAIKNELIQIKDQL